MFGSKRGIFLSQRKCILDLLKETSTLGCKVACSPIEQNHKLWGKTAKLFEDSIKGVGVRGSGMTIEEMSLWHHRRMGHTSLSIFESIVPSLYEKAKKKKLICNACELGKHIRNSYHSFGNKNSWVFDHIHSNVCGSCLTNTINVYKYFVTLLIIFLMLLDYI